MTKVRVQDATKELSTNAGKMLNSIVEMRKKTQNMLGNLQKISNYIFVITPASVDISGDFLSLVDAFNTTGF